MRQVTGSMANVVKGMDGAMKAMDLEKVIWIQVEFSSVGSADVVVRNRSLLSWIASRRNLRTST